MADGSDGNLFDPYGLERLLEIVEEIRDKGVVLNTDKMSAPLKEVVDSLYKKVQQSVQNTGKIDPKEIKPLVDSIITTLRETGMATKDLRGYSRELRKALEDIAKKGNLDEDKLVHMFVASISNMFKSGVLDPSKKTAKDDYITKLLTAAFSDKQVKAINSVRDAILYVFGQQQGQEKTKRRQFIEDLVAGLSQSKFFGGAITDFVKLIIYMVGSWLKDKGPLGKALTVALVAGAPVIAAAVVKALVSGLGKLFIGLGRAFVGLLKVAVLTPLKTLGSKLLTTLVTRMAAQSAVNAAAGLGGKAITVRAAGQVAQLGLAGQEALLARATGGRITQQAASLGQAALLEKAIGGKVVGDIARKEATKTAGKVAAGFVGKRLAGAVAANAIPVAGQIISIGMILWTIVDLIKMAFDWFKNKDNKEGGFLSKLLGGNQTSSSSSTSKPFVATTTSNIQAITSGDFEGRSISSGFGWRTNPVTYNQEFHKGIDLRYNEGEKVGAFVGGRVVRIESESQSGGFGNSVILEDALGIRHRYSHLSKVKVAKDQEVSANQVIGLAGHTGDSKGPHVDYRTYNRVGRNDNIGIMGTELNPVDLYNSTWYKKGLKGYEPGETEDAQTWKSVSIWSRVFTPAKVASEELAESVKNSIGITPKDDEGSIERGKRVPGDTEAFEQWERIKAKNTPKKEEATVPVSIPPQEIKLDFTGTERFSKVLQNTLDAQHQSYKQY